MKKIYFIVVGISVLIIGLSCSKKEDNDMQERAKISLREVGNQLLLKQQDSLSLILPIKNIDDSKYRLSFENMLSFEPNDLVTIIEETIDKSSLPRHYRVEVIQCTNNEVAYSYQMSEEEERTIIPCESRKLPQACYHIEVKFLQESSSRGNSQVILFSFGFVTIVFVLFGVYRNRTYSDEMKDQNFVNLGSFKFYKAQNILIKDAEEITLSKKECELLAIFVSRPNETITREELTKRVWEDNGVIVGRSLDTFISKLRKKLQDDTSVKITNVHGIGYKLDLS